MRVRITNLSTGSPAFTAEVSNGSVADGNIELASVSTEGGTFLRHLKHYGPVEWIDKFGNQGFRYHIEEIDDLVSGPEPTPPSSLMQTIGKITRKEWCEITVMVNDDIDLQNAGPNGGVPPVNTLQAIRVVYAFERYLREQSLED